MNRKKILLVDDSSTILMMEKFILRNGPYEILTATNGEEGVLKAAGADARPDPPRRDHAEDGRLRSVPAAFAAPSHQRDPDHHGHHARRGGQRRRPAGRTAAPTTSPSRSTPSSCWPKCATSSATRWPSDQGCRGERPFVHHRRAGGAAAVHAGRCCAKTKSCARWPRRSRATSAGWSSKSSRRASSWSRRTSCAAPRKSSKPSGWKRSCSSSARGTIAMRATHELERLRARFDDVAHENEKYADAVPPDRDPEQQPLESLRRVVSAARQRRARHGAHHDPGDRRQPDRLRRSGDLRIRRGCERVPAGVVVRRRSVAAEKLQSRAAGRSASGSSAAKSSSTITSPAARTN